MLVFFLLLWKVSESAAKEYQIEEALTKMEAEWMDSRLEIVGYRETGTGILKGVDEINTVLDEQVKNNQELFANHEPDPRLTEVSKTGMRFRR